jgi:hypothetical protein
VDHRQHIILAPYPTLSGMVGFKVFFSVVAVCVQGVSGCSLRDDEYADSEIMLVAKQDASVNVEPNPNLITKPFSLASYRHHVCR